MNNDMVALDDLRREFFSEVPKDVDGVYNRSVLYFRRWCWRKIFGILKITNIPESWDQDYMLNALFKSGYFAVTDTSVGVVPLECGLTGINIYNHPTTCIFANPVLGSFERTIGVDAELIKLQWDYHGLNDLVERVAVMLAMCESSIAVNLMNSKVTFIAMVGDKAQAESMKKMYDMLSAGNPAVFVRKDIVNPDAIFYNHVKENFVADQVHTLMRAIQNEFLTCLGLVYIDKRERVVDKEVLTYFDEIRDSVAHWDENIKDGVKKVNAMFGLNVSIEIITANTAQEVDAEDGDDTSESY